MGWYRGKSTRRQLDANGLQCRWDPLLNAHAVEIYPGECYITRGKEETAALVTTLGSCVSACIRDRLLGVGGMNHFMLPQKLERHGVCAGEVSSSAARYGDHAMELLIASILRIGGERRNLEIKVFGGATMLAHMEDIGGRNIEFIKRYLETKGLMVQAEDLGGVHPRKIVYFPATGKVMVKRISPLRNSEIAHHDLHYQLDLSERDHSGKSEPDL